ncbi:Wzz/FepE/Etk N-terminal domain-containing protein, partial [Pseudomonas sp. GW704-F5]
MQSATAVTSHHSDDTDLDFMALVGTLLDHKWLIGGISIAFMALGAAYSVLTPPIYQATALVQVEPKKGDMLGFSDVGSLLGKESPTVTEIELIRSRITIGTAVDNLNLDLDVKPKRFPLLGGFVARRFKPTEQEAVAAPWLGLSNFAWGGEELKFSELRLPTKLLGQELTLTAGNGGSFTLSDQDEAVLLEGQVGRAYDSSGIKLRVEQLRANPGTTFSVVRSPRLSTILRYQKLLDVAERGKESGIIGLALESPRPADAIQVLNEVARIYVRQNIDRTSAEAAQSLAFLKGQLPQVRKDVEQAEAALNQFQIRNKTIDISLEAKAILDQIVALDASISELKMQQAEIERKFTPQHPVYRALLTQLAELTERQNELAKKVESLPTTQQELLSLTRDLKVSTEI